MSEREAILAKLSEEHGDIASFDVPGFGLVVLAVPDNDAEYNDLVNRLADTNADKAVAMRNFALACVVHPDRDTAKRIFKKRPAFALACCKRGQQLCGSEIKELGKD